MARRMLAASVGVLLLGWLGFRWAAFAGDQNGLIRLTLSTLFAGMILFRPKPGIGRGIPWWAASALAGGGTFITILGLVLPIQQLEWLGLECLAAGVLCWILPRWAHRDVWRAAFVLYWAVPLPDALFVDLQGAMQALSVKGGEALLQIGNVRAWAHGTAIYTPSATYHVPGWCSGMRTATTVLLLTLGMGILRRLRIRYCVLFAMAAELQVLVLNIIRICLMVVLVPSFHSEQATKFLHDTTGLIVLAAVLLVAAELGVLVTWRNRHLHAKYELDQHRMRHVTEHPPFWRELKHKREMLAILAVALAVTTIIVVRAQRYHRAQMLKDVAEGQRDLGNLDIAQAAADDVLRLTPDDSTWRFTRLRLLLLRGEHEAVLEGLDEIGPRHGANTVQAQVLRAYALMSLGELDQAAAIVDKLPERIRQSDPRAAMILAELSMRGNRPDEVATYVVTAAQWTPNAGRIRSLYPYLRFYRKWTAIANSDSDAPFQEPQQAYSLLEALMNLNATARVAQLTRQFREQWPRDPRLLEPLYFLAIQNIGRAWTRRFASHLLKTLPEMHVPARLYELIYKCMDLRRPDLAWAIARRIREIDPENPTLDMAITVYGNQWLRYSKHHLGLPAGGPDDWVDVGRLARIAPMLPAWQPALDRLPYVRELAEAEETLDVRKQHLNMALATFGKRTEDGNMDLDMQYLHVRALERKGRIKEARQTLERIVRDAPEEAAGARVLLSSIYERAGQWVNVYETLFNYLDPLPTDGQVLTLNQLAERWRPFESAGTMHRGINLDPLIRLGRAQLELHLGVAAVHTASRAGKLFPYAPQAQALLGTALLRYATPAEALEVLGRIRFHPYRELDFLEARALYETQRYTELENFAQQKMLPQVNIPARAPQDMVLPPAELSLLWHHFNTPSEEEFAQQADNIRTNLPDTTSPALEAMMKRWLAAYEQHCEGATADPIAWVATGRTAVEKATAMNQLTILLCRERRIPEARATAMRAVELLPDSPILWIIAISLSQGDMAVIDRARDACPTDPEIWLAKLVAATTRNKQDNGPPSEQLARWVDEFTADPHTDDYPVEALTRAAEYLLRKGFPAAACDLMRSAEPRARGLLPTHIMGIRCALQSGDAAWANRATSLAIKNSRYPVPALYKQLVALKTAKGNLHADADTLDALRTLKRLEPETSLWPQMLGYLRFQRGGWEIVDALSSMSMALDNGATNRLPFVVAAEAARLLRDYDKSVDLLKEAIKLHPGDPALVNNLAFTLANDQQRVTEAVGLLPELRPFADDQDAVLDTMTFILLRSNRPEAARELAAQLTHRAVPGSRYWLRGKRYEAEADWLAGKPERARRILEALLDGPKGMTEEDVKQATELLAVVTEATQEAHPKPAPELAPLPIPKADQPLLR